MAEGSLRTLSLDSENHGLPWSAFHGQPEEEHLDRIKNIVTLSDYNKAFPVGQIDGRMEEGRLHEATERILRCVCMDSFQPLRYTPRTRVAPHRPYRWNYPSLTAPL